MPDTWKLAGCEGMEVLFFFCFSKDNKDIQVVIASGLHLYPFRTEKLNLTTPMVLRNSGRVGSCRIIKKKGGEREDRKVSFSSFLLFLFPAAHDDTPSFHFPHPSELSGLYYFIYCFPVWQGRAEDIFPTVEIDFYREGNEGCRRGWK